jgi:hypothetical protein
MGMYVSMQTVINVLTGQKMIIAVTSGKCMIAVITVDISRIYGGGKIFRMKSNMDTAV